LDPELLQMGCWDAPVAASGLSDHRKYERFVKRCRRYYQKKIERILRESK
jgi:hypothetical protein